METERIVLTRRRLPEKYAISIDGSRYEVKAELVDKIGIWPFRVYTYRLDFSDINEGYIGAFFRNMGKPPEVTTEEGCRVTVGYC